MSEDRQESHRDVSELPSLLVLLMALTLSFRPPWKLFAFTFWGSKPYDMKYHSNTEPYSFNPLGSEWNIVSVLNLAFTICSLTYLVSRPYQVGPFVTWGFHCLMIV